jgi:hypothetical protein
VEKRIGKDRKRERRRGGDGERGSAAKKMKGRRERLRLRADTKKNKREVGRASSSLGLDPCTGPQSLGVQLLYWEANAWWVFLRTMILASDFPCPSFAFPSAEQWKGGKSALSSSSGVRV